MRQDPVPLSTPILENSTTLSHPWFVWFRNLSQYLKESQTIISVTPSSGTNYDYCLNGNVLVINYSGVDGAEINLPAKIASDQIINFWEGDIIKKLEISKNSMKIVVPSGIIKFTATILVRV